MKNKIPEYKKKIVNDLSKLAETKKTILITSIKGIPGSQYQEIVKSLRGLAVVKVPKKNLILMAFDKNKKEESNKLKAEIEKAENFAILFSDLDTYELAGELIKSKSPAKAKSGQEAPEDIEIPAGPTDLVPGPAISELGALGIQIQIEKGKIHIKEPKIIVKKNEKIKANAAEMMSKLGIKPFSVGFAPLIAFDNEKNIIYTEINIDTEKALEELKYAYSRALPFAISISYANDESIRFLILKAVSHERKLNRIISGEPEVVVEVPAVEVKEEPKKEEKSVESSAGLASLFG